MGFDIPFLEMHMDSGTLLQNLENVWKLLHVLSKSWSKFMFSIRSYIKNISKYKVQFSDHIYTNFLDFFHVDHRYKYQTEVWKKLWFLTNYCSLDNDDPISFFMILLRTQIFVYKDFSCTSWLLYSQYCWLISKIDSNIGENFLNQQYCW